MKTLKEKATYLAKSLNIEVKELISDIDCFYIEYDLFRQKFVNYGYGDFITYDKEEAKLFEEERFGVKRFTKNNWELVNVITKENWDYWEGWICPAKNNELTATFEVLKDWLFELQECKNLKAMIESEELKNKLELELISKQEESPKKKLKI